jgi:hypothetical protein
VESGVKSLSYRSFDAWDRLWERPGTLWKEGFVPFWMTTSGPFVDSMAAGSVEKTINQLKSMNTVE